MGALPYFSSVPGMAVPGMAQPGRAQRLSYPLYQYFGQQAVSYLDYLDSVTGHTLTVVPGGFYTMTVVNSRHGLTVPPPDGEWDTGTGAQFRIVLAKRPPSPAELAAARERALAAHGHYFPGACGHCDPAPRETPPPAGGPLAAHGHYPGGSCRHCNPVPREPAPPVARRAAGPDFAPAPSMAQVRADLERSKITHGHYAPGGCRQCANAGQR